MNETIAQQIFEPEQARKQPGEADYDIAYKSTYAFQEGIVPLGKLRMRQQRRKFTECTE